jgi:hypothetical protein
LTSSRDLRYQEALTSLRTAVEWADALNSRVAAIAGFSGAIFAVVPALLDHGIERVRGLLIIAGVLWLACALTCAWLYEPAPLAVGVNPRHLAGGGAAGDPSADWDQYDREEFFRLRIEQLGDSWESNKRALTAKACGVRVAIGLTLLETVVLGLATLSV